ncbi:MAG: PTS fructose transporter subunit IIC [Niameybacter sp.]|uniref:PTS fructose transporter subunit IIC n=1 Tax=Niameybacter sp. TaxID=2033640 RepID=UPI002FC7706A
MKKQSLGQQIYEHLMNGINHMLPFVIGGGLLMALAFLFDDYSVNPANFGSNTPFAAMLKQIGDLAFGFMLPMLAGYIAVSVAGQSGLVTGFIGGMMAQQSGAGFLGALLAGFIGGYVIVLLSKILKFIPKSFEGLKVMLLYPLLGLFVVGVIMMFVVNPPVAALNGAITNTLTSMGDSSKVVLGLVVAAMMAVDMGGPLNKSAYMFAVVCLDAGNASVMAATIVGGMVPATSIALATTLFKNKFTAKEREAGLTNYILGMSFITEGAISFAASDPLRVLPSVTLGSAVAGGLAMMFNCASRAPHGGIFVLPVIENPMGFVIAYIGGVLVAAVMMGLLKKPAQE